MCVVSAERKLTLYTIHEYGFNNNRTQLEERASKYSNTGERERERETDSWYTHTLTQARAKGRELLQQVYMCIM